VADANAFAAFKTSFSIVTAAAAFVTQRGGREAMNAAATHRQLLLFPTISDRRGSFRRNAGKQPVLPKTHERPRDIGNACQNDSETPR